MFASSDGHFTYVYDVHYAHRCTVVFFGSEFAATVHNCASFEAKPFFSRVDLWNVTGPKVRWKYSI